jgi:mono/diheme cytochrome c family protein
MAMVAGGVAVTALLAAGARGQQTTEAFSGGANGAAVYKTYCATCHGVDAKGDGPLAQNLRHTPSDLTLLAKRNGGTFDAIAVYRMIDGRQPLKNHGGSDMPVWGDAFKRSSEGYSEEAVKARIEAIVEHLRSVQKQ